MITNKQKKMNSGTKEAVECYLQEKEKRTHDVIDPLKQKQIHRRYIIRKRKHNFRMEYCLVRKKKEGVFKHLATYVSK